MDEVATEHDHETYQPYIEEVIFLCNNPFLVLTLLWFLLVYRKLLIRVTFMVVRTFARIQQDGRRSCMQYC